MPSWRSSTVPIPTRAPALKSAYARAKGKPVIGVRTDFRDGEVHGLNIMTAGICTSVIKLPSTSSSIGEVAERVMKALNDVALDRVV